MAYAEPTGREGVQVALASVLESPANRHRLIALSLQQASRHGWNRAVAETVTAYEWLA